MMFMKELLSVLGLPVGREGLSDTPSRYVAFLAEAIDEIEDEAIADDIRDRLEGWLARHEH